MMELWPFHQQIKPQIMEKIWILADVGGFRIAEVQEMKIAISKRKHIPVLKVAGVEWSFTLWEYKTAKYVESTGLHLDSVSIAVLLKELPLGHYLPPFSLEGKTVLDIGACCGETAWYYLQHGAKKVIAIECDSKRLEILKNNTKRLGLNIDIVAEPFSVSHLTDFDYDFIKCDIEGYEMLLLESKSELKPCVVEVHNLWIKEQFEKVGFRMISSPEYSDLARVSTCVMSNCHEKRHWLADGIELLSTVNGTPYENADIKI
jgi:hypothetical protein